MEKNCDNTSSTEGLKLNCCALLKFSLVKKNYFNSIPDV